jgi:hypothetical protein
MQWVKAITFTGKQLSTNGTDEKRRKNFYEGGREETMTD